MRFGEFKVMVAALGVAAMTLQGCGKYEDGPAFSLKTKNSRLTGEWSLVSLNGQVLEDGEYITFEFEKDGDFVFSYGYEDGGFTETYKYAGSWDWVSGKESLIMSITGGEILNFEVQRLTSSELNMQYISPYGGYIQEWIFEKQ